MKTALSRNTTQPAAPVRRGVLCGTDFSEHARHAVRTAAAIAKKLDEPLILAHAVETPKLGASHATVLGLFMTSRQDDLRHDAEALRKTGVEVEEHTPAGQPDEALVKLAQSESPRLLVISSLGRRGAERWMLGSVAERTTERATTPSLVVRDAGPLIKWARGERPLKVFVGFNFTLTSEAVLRWVKDLQEIGPCEVVIGYLHWPAEQWDRVGNGGPKPPTRHPHNVHTVLERDVKLKADELLGSIPFRLRVEPNWGRADARLADLAREEGADLIVVGSHQYRGFERFWYTSTSRGLLHQAEMNVAIVPLATNEEREISIAPIVRHVLVPTDFSEFGNAAIPHAYSILRSGGTVHLIHVVSQNSGRSVSSGSRANAQNSRHMEECTAKLRSLIPMEASAQGITTRIEVIKSRDVAVGICRSAKRLGADVICLATRGQSGLSKLLMGSVAQEVMTRSRRPLFLVRPKP